MKRKSITIAASVLLILGIIFFNNVPALAGENIEDLKKQIESLQKREIGRAHVWTPVTFLYLVCRLLLEKKKKKEQKKKKKEEKEEKKKKKM